VDIGDTRREIGEDTEDATLKMVSIGPIAGFGEYTSHRQGWP
jgi:hypothetical protein